MERLWLCETDSAQVSIAAALTWTQQNTRPSIRLGLKSQIEPGILDRIHMRTSPSSPYTVFKAAIIPLKQYTVAVSPEPGPCFSKKSSCCELARCDFLLHLDDDEILLPEVGLVVSDL